MFNLTGRKFLVTGGSGSIGRAIAQAFYNSGATVCISGTNAEALEITSEGKMKIILCDLKNKDDVISLVDRATEAMYGFDGIVCNAGITRDKLLMRMTDDEWNEVLQVNLTSTFQLNRSACKILSKNRWGRIINISSVVAFTGNHGQANYTASKAGMIAMSKSIAKEYANRGITVNCIAPGFIESQMTAALTSDQKEAICVNIPMKKMGSAEDIAAGAVFLASNEAGYVTGQVLHINGGLFMC